MLKRNITYTDFDGNEVTETFYFNISKPELIEMEVDVDGGMAKMLERIIAANSSKEIIQTFKKIILASYGVRSEDGKRFIKNEQLREEFSQMAAYHQLFLDLSMNSEAAADFIKGVIPQDMVGAIEEAEAVEKAKNAVHQGRVTTSS